MSTIDVYAFEDEGDESATDWTTFDITEAREYAQTNRLALIAREYEYSDSSLVEDYRPGHTLDGTKIEKELGACLYCGSVIDPELGSGPPTGEEHDGSADDPRAPGDWDDICDSCNYGKDLRGGPHANPDMFGQVQR